MASRKPASTGASLVRSTLAEQTYEILKERILDQKLPPGARLNIDAISKELSVSSSPIREALVRLEAERLVVLELYSGYSVAPQPTPQYLHKLLDFRILVEGACADTGARERDPATLATLTNLFATMAKTNRLGTKYVEYRKFVEADAQFHMAIVDSAHNEVISGIYAGMHVILLQSRLYLNRRGGPTSSQTVLDEHRAILKAYEDGDGERAAQVIRDHLEHGRQRLLMAMGDGA
jgi:DNA-binding GntR family transcriptional regulator